MSIIEQISVSSNVTLLVVEMHFPSDIRLHDITSIISQTTSVIYYFIFIREIVDKVNFTVIVN
jgi:hypothetical protein